MNKNELMIKRARAWEAAKAFLDSHQGENGILSAEDDATYTRMEKEITDLGNEIKRMERLEAMDREMSLPTSNPLTTKPDGAANEVKKKGIASDSYKEAFWNNLRTKDRNRMNPELLNVLTEGVDTEGGYLVPDEYERTLIQGLNENGVIRAHAHVIRTSNGSHKIPIVASHGTATWMGEKAAFTDSDEAFDQVQLDAHKVGTAIKISDELLSDSVFNLDSYISREFARRIGDKEEEAFLVGDGSNKPTGILDNTKGAQLGVTAASATAITADELMDLYYSLKAPYRRRAIFVLNDSTVKLIRKLKDSTGNYLWQPAIKDGEVSTILGRPYETSPFAPAAASSAKAVIFGDLNYYWIGDRQGISFKRLNELYAATGQVGFLAYKRVDGLLVLPEAVKVLQMKA